MSRFLSIAAGLVLGAVVTTGAQANTISIYDDSDTYLMDASVDTVPATAAVLVQGFVSPFDGTLSDTRADEKQLGNANPTTELAFLNSMISPDVAGATKICDGNCSDTFTITTEYFLLKLGQDTAFFKNIAGAAITITLSVVGSTGSGLSHITTFGPSAVPLPGALPLFLTGLGGLGWLAGPPPQQAASFCLSAGDVI